MVAPYPKIDPHAPIVVIDVGNTRIALATWSRGQLRTPLTVSLSDRAGFVEALRAHVEAMPKGKTAAVAVASVVPEALEWIAEDVESVTGRTPLIVGDQIPLPIDLDLTDKTTVGVDRVCAAAAAYEVIQAGCIIVDFGTAVTVDFVDDEGVFRGGAILPGARLQLRALHGHTAALPQVDAGFPDTAFGRNTVEAMQIGVCRGLTGAVRAIVESYATAQNRWPQVVATGGDLHLLGPHCDFLDTQVEHLVLRGVGVAYDKHLEAKGV